MASHTWHGQTYDRAVQVGPDDGPQVAAVSHAVPGVDGLVRIRMGFRGHAIALAGEHRAATVADCEAWKAAQQALVGRCLDTLSLYDGAIEYQHVELVAFRKLSLRPAEGGGFAIRWAAQFLQVHPNSEA